AGLLEHLAERLQRFLITLLQKQARAQKADELDLRAVVGQPRTGEIFRGTSVVALDRLPTGGELLLLSFRVRHSGERGSIRSKYRTRARSASFRICGHRFTQSLPMPEYHAADALFTDLQRQRGPRARG